MRLLTTLTGNLYLVLGSLVFGLSALPVALFPRGANGVFLLARLWAWGLLAASGVRVTCRFEAPLEPSRSHVFLANHQSMFDIPLVLGTAPVQLRFAAKRSLFRIPVFGWAIRAGGFIPVDRGDSAKARATFAAAERRLRGGTSVILFPEGSRSLDGYIHDFERGGFLLAIKTGLPIVPVGIRGTLAIQRRGSARIAPGPVEVRYGSAIDPAAFGIRGRAALEAEVRRQLEELAGAPSVPGKVRGPGEGPTRSSTRSSTRG